MGKFKYSLLLTFSSMTLHAVVTLCPINITYISMKRTYL